MEYRQDITTDQVDQLGPDDPDVTTGDGDGDASPELVGELLDDGDDQEEE